MSEDGELQTMMAATSNDEQRKRRHPESYGPKLILHYLDLAPLPPADVAEFMGYWAKDFSRDFGQLARGVASWNWWWMLATIWLLSDARGGAEPCAKLIELLRYQLGEAEPKPEESLLRFFAGSESNSTTYEGFRWGSVCAWEIWARRWKNRADAAELLRLCGRFSETDCAIIACGAAPFPDQQWHRGNAGLWYDGPTVAAPGERSTPAHSWQNDLGPMFCLATDYPLYHSKREDWPAQVARACKDLGVREQFKPLLRLSVNQPSAGVDELLAQIRFWSPVYWCRWDTLRLCYSGPRLNLNTPKVYWSLYDYARRSMTIGFPWQGGQHRGKGASRDSGDCKLSMVAPDRLAIVASTEEGLAQEFVPRGEPNWHAVLGQSGYKTAGDFFYA